MQYPPPHPYAPNPYAPPAGMGYPGYPAPGGPHVHGDPRGHKPWVKWAYLASSAAGTLCLIAAVLFLVLSPNDVFAPSPVGAPPSDLSTEGALGLIFFGVWGLLAHAAMVLALYWIYGAWAWIPYEHRFQGPGKWMTPGKAIGFLFIPYFNLYWMFVMPLALAKAMQSVSYSNQVHTEPANGLVLGAAICHIVPLANILASPVLWFLLMRRIDTQREAVIGQLAGYAHARA